VALAGAGAVFSWRSAGSPVVFQTDLTWGAGAADTAETRHLPFEVSEAGAAYRVKVVPVMDPDQSTKRPAHLRARILGPDGRHLVGADFRLFPDDRRTLLGRTKVWPTGTVSFRTGAPGRCILQLQRREPEVHRVFVRVEGPLRR
jgi:hypothetical protein